MTVRYRFTIHKSNGTVSKRIIRKTNYSVGGSCALFGSRDIRVKQEACRAHPCFSMLSDEPSGETSTESSPEERQAGTRPLREEDVPGASLNGRAPNNLKVHELKRWLLCRNASTRGKKADLVLRYVSYVLLILPWLVYTLPVGPIHSCLGLRDSITKLFGFRERWSIATHHRNAAAFVILG